MHTKDGLFHGKQKLSLIDATVFAEAMEKLLLAEIYVEDGARHTGLVRLGEGMKLLSQAVFARSDDGAAETGDLRRQLEAAVRCACAARDELKRRGIELAIDLKDGIVLPLEKPASAGGSQ